MKPQTQKEQVCGTEPHQTQVRGKDNKEKYINKLHNKLSPKTSG